MAKKGASNRYQNTKGSSSTVGYSWAKAFNKRSLLKHFKKHGDDTKTYSVLEYKAKTLNFANTIYTDKNDVIAIKSLRNTTFKFLRSTLEFAIITSSGILITYFVLEDKDQLDRTYQREYQKIMKLKEAKHVKKNN